MISVIQVIESFADPQAPPSLSLSLLEGEVWSAKSQNLDGSVFVFKISKLGFWNRRLGCYIFNLMPYTVKIFFSFYLIVYNSCKKSNSKKKKKILEKKFVTARSFL